MYMHWCMSFIQSVPLYNHKVSTENSLPTYSICTVFNSSNSQFLRSSHTDNYDYETLIYLFLCTEIGNNNAKMNSDFLLIQKHSVRILSTPALVH